MVDMTKPLNGLVVLDLSNVLAGPFCCHQLAHMGANVIKVETPHTGDLARQLGADQTLNEKLMGISYLAQNAGKKSVTLNLKAAKGKEILRKLVQKADVLVENFRPGVMDRLELGYESLKDINPRLVYCAISGFGQSGPMRDLPAYDQIVQGLSGIMSITGEEDVGTYRVGYPVADTVGGMTAAYAITAALSARGLDPEGATGCFIDVSMLESVISTMGWVISNYLIGGVIPKPMGNENFTSAPSGTFKTADGSINIAANKQEQFELVCDSLGVPELKTDKRFETRVLRIRNRKELSNLLEQVLRQKDTSHWTNLLNSAGVPAGAVLTIPEVLSMEQISGRGMIAQFDNVGSLDRGIEIVRTGFKVDGKPPKVDSSPPELGSSNEEVYGMIGLSSADIEVLRSEGVL